MQKLGNDPVVMQSEDKVGAGPEKMAVNLSLIEQYAGQSNIK